ncbi:DNA-directed RNA polymerase subunit beta', partial [candidate division WWE3 bacterium]|nr:DNA-directed RNA polymerase subunit beta' [candidate division WWE3 bacterium]
EVIIRNEKRMLQESVDALLDSSKQRNKARSSRGKKTLKSLADQLKGKQGRFRQNLLGKRVDYSGRGVIVNGPTLRLDECGIPKEMALELFKPFVLRELLSRGIAPNVKSAKYVLESRVSEVWDILEEVVKDHPVLLNRQPTLWRLGIQAFYPKLIEGNAIRLHLCVCPGYNADFDGDQMAVLVPLSKQSVEEAKTKMISIANLRRPSDGKPFSIPAKIVLFGIYYITSLDNSTELYEKVFASAAEARYAFDALSIISERQLIKVRINGKIVETTLGRLRFNEYLPENYAFVNEAVDKSKVEEILVKVFDELPNQDIADLIDNLKDFGLKYGTSAGQSVSLDDVAIPAERETLIEAGKAKVFEVNKNFNMGYITEREKHRHTEDLWEGVRSEIDDKIWGNLTDSNPLKLLINSKATRASRTQVSQLAGIRGLVFDASGNIVTMPLLGNYKLGLSALEYFVGARGARKGLVDKSLKTADAGYLTRKLVDVAQEVIVRQDDCGTTSGRTIRVGEKTLLNSFEERFKGRILAEEVKKGNKKLLERGHMLTAEDLRLLQDEKVDTVVIRSPLSCETRRGICAQCYGADIMTQSLVDMGVAVGVSAAQAIGEPGTQLTMRTFHTGGVVGKDITQGLPRIEELVEARAPKFLSVMSDITGSVTIIESGDERKILVKASDPSEEQKMVEYVVDPIATIIVEDGQLVAKGDKLTEGHLDLADLLSTVGVAKTKEYILSEIQNVYASQGVPLNDKHIEVIVKQMFGHVKVEDAGDTSFLPTDIATKDTFIEENERVIAEGGTPATARVTLLGITKASLNTDSFLSAAAFIQTSQVLTDAASSGKVDMLQGLKENVIIGRLIPTGERAEIE